MDLPDKIKELPNLSSAEIVSYLSSPLFKGIGKKTANKLVQHFGQEILYILDQKPQLLTTIPSLYPYQIKKIIAAWQKSKNDPTRDAIALLLGAGASFKLSLNICEYYSNRTLNILKQNPYQIINDLDRVGFKTADRLALSLGIKPNSQYRYLQAIIYTLKEASRNGHCFLPRTLLLEKTYEILALKNHSPDRSQINKIIVLGIEQKDLASFESNDSIYLSSTFATELRVAKTIKTFLSYPTKSIEKLFDWLELEFFNEVNALSLEQQSALLMAQRHKISILTGGPGRGKTYVLKTFVKWLKRNQAKIALAAPTGKAAHRLSEVTQLKAMTIHRLLQWSGVDRRFF
ncbi:MAG: helix-hairpin-helix domain-containing protein [Prochloraceae cyanobacterium]